MADKSAFGLPMGETPEDDPYADAPEIPDVVEAEAPAVEAEETVSTADPLAPVEEEAPAEVPEPALDEAPEEVIAEEEPAGTPYEGRYGDKYKTIEQMEEAHRNALALAQRQAERAKETEEQLQQATAYLQALDQYFAEQERLSKQATETEAITKQATELGLDEETLRIAREIAAKEAEERMAPLQAQIAQQQQEAQLAQMEAITKAQISAFRAANPTDADTEIVMVEVFNEFGLDPTVGENYPIALEAAKNPELRSVLRANPNYIDSDDGLNLARRLAGVHTVSNAAAPTRDLTEARKRATVEAGSSGAAPEPEALPKDEWDAVLAEASNARKKSAFGV